MSSNDFRIVESDGIGNTTATYVFSSSKKDAITTTARVDKVLPENPKTVWQKALDVFLPAGYPHSVTEDYLEYQIYDSLQAFSSSIAGLLSSRAVLEGVGVGDANASTTAAVLLSIFQESLGRVTTILFAHRLGTSLEPECKMYRLLADVFNDTAMVLECLSPALPKPFRVGILAGSSALKALCGVAAGSAKASLSAHFARWGNLGELNAKDSSQETVISLMGMLAGSVVVSWITTPVATWTTLILLLSIHLAMNYRAVKAVSMRTLNRQRANIVIAHVLAKDKVLLPKEISRLERVFEYDGLVRNASDESLGYCRIGVSLHDFLMGLGAQSPVSGRSTQVKEDDMSALRKLYDGLPFMVWLDTRTREARILLHKDCTAVDQLQAWCFALLSLHALSQDDDTRSSKDGQDDREKAFRLLTSTRRTSSDFFINLQERLLRSGWDLDTAALETHQGSRFAFVEK